MLKKSLIAIALLAIVLPVFAAETVETDKFHKPWPGKIVKTWNYQDVKSINVVMDVGYWIEIKFTGDIEVQQDAALAAATDGNTFYTYSGCLGSGGMDVKTNFPATLKGKIEAKSAAGGEWGVTIQGAPTYAVPAGTTNDISVCVTGKKVYIQNLPSGGGNDNMLVALVTIQVIPTEFASGTTTTF
jgi:hypothetical protein